MWEMRRWSYLDLGGGTEDTVLVAGSGRSGTTWIEELLNRNNDFRIMFEPFWGKQVREVRHFSDHQYLPPGNNDSRFVEPAGRILSGHVRNRWIDHQNTAHLPRRRLVKEIRANNWLGWAADHWPHMPVIFIVRHPMAVVSSGKTLGWGDGLDRLLAQPNLLADHLDPDSEGYVRSLTDPWQRAIARWCIENLVPFRTLGPTRATLVLYEVIASHSDDDITACWKSSGRGVMSGSPGPPSDLRAWPEPVHHYRDRPTRLSGGFRRSMRYGGGRRWLLSSGSGLVMSMAMSRCRTPGLRTACGRRRPRDRAAKRLGTLTESDKLPGVIG